MQKNKTEYQLKFISFFLLIFSFTAVNAQDKKKSSFWSTVINGTEDTTVADYYGSKLLRNEDYVYNKNIKTVELRNESFEMTQPILNLGSEDKLKLSFDDLDADLKNYSYTFIHCDANWEASGLNPADFIDGFQENNINEYRYSFNTLIRYTHYNAVFPSNSMRLTKTGNYILKVFLSGEPDNIILTKRFVVFQNKLQIDARVYQASIIADKNYKQEIDFTINHSGYTISNPFGDLKVVITQNNRWDNAKTDLKPLFVKDNELVYDYDEANVFPGGNEFRNFDIKSIRYHSERIYTVDTDSLGNHVTLLSDEKRNIKRYYTNPDLNGNYLVKIQEGKDSDVEADYCFVHFFLPYDEVLTDGNLYVFGAFNNWKCTTENLMRYNEKRFGYEAIVLFKQGYYNYVYGYLKDGAKTVDETLIEGTHSETENDYTIYVYHRQIGTFYDQLIGVKHLNSRRDY